MEINGIQSQQPIYPTKQSWNILPQKITMQYGHTYITLLHLPGAIDVKENLI